MNIKIKELGQDVIFKFDKKNYSLFLKKIKEIGKELEYASNIKNLKYSVLCNFQKKPFMEVKGWCSRVVDSNNRVSEVLFMDYDNILFRVMESEMKYFMEKYNLSPFYIFKSSEDIDNNNEVYGNYMVICITKMPFKQVVDIQDISHCDVAYKRMPLLFRFKTYVLRLGDKGKKGKPEFKCIVGDLNKVYGQDVSQAHLEVLKQLYPIPDIKYTNLDNNHKLFLTEYTTASP